MIKVEDKQLYELPDGWSWVRLEQLVANPRSDIVDGPFGSDMKASEYVEHGIPIIRLQNIERNLFLKKNMRYISSEKAKRLERHSFTNNDIVITKLGSPLGKACLVPSDLEKGVIVADVVRLRVDERFVSRKYLVFAINSYAVTTNLNLSTKGTTRPRVNLGHIRSLKIPLAPLNEQKRIVSKVEALFAESKIVREALDKVLVLLRRFRQSVLAKAFRGELTQRNPNDEPAQSLLQKMEQEERRQQTKTLGSNKQRIDDFPTLPDTWEWAKLGKIATIVGGGTPRRDTPEYYENGTIPWVTPTDVKPNGILTIFETAEKITEKALGKSSAKLLPTGTVLFSSRASIGKIAIAGRALATNQGFANLIPKSLLDFRYLAYGLRYFAKDIERLGSGTTYIEVAKSSLKEFYFPLAPLKEQRCIANKIQGLFSFADTIEAAIKKTRERVGIIDKAILDKAFRGELVPQELNDEPALILLKRVKGDLATPRVEARRQKAKTDYQTKLQTEEKQIKNLEEVLRKIGPTTMEQAFEASGLSMNEFWDKLKTETKAGRIEKSRRGNLIFLRVKN